MASKWSIENSVNIKMLLNMIQAAGGIDEDGNIFLPIEKTEYGLLKTSKEILEEHESSGMSISDLYNKLLEQTEGCHWSNSSVDIQIPRSVPDPLDEEGTLT
jgi:hypothetical protein